MGGVRKRMRGVGELRKYFESSVRVVVDRTNDIFIGNLINVTFLNDSIGSREEFSRLISSYFAVALFFVPIFLYLMSGIFHGILWIFYRIW